MAFYQYNRVQYNNTQYGSGFHNYVLALLESIANSDGLTDTNRAAWNDFVFMADALQKTIPVKGFTESIRTNDWLQISRSGSQWSN